jgi:hypothetical protein
VEKFLAALVTQALTEEGIVFAVAAKLNVLEALQYE